jgi:VWFA-related protein
MMNVNVIAIISVAFSFGAVGQSRDEGPAINPVTRGKARIATRENEHRTHLRVDTTLVPIPVAVTDPLSRFVTGLEKEDFRLYEDKVEQQITQFSCEDTPISVGIVFDTSGSMGDKLGWSRQAVAQFLKTANPEDEFFLIEFNNQANMIAEFTSISEDIQNRLTFTQAKGSTALLDGVYLAMHQMRKARNPRRAILIISDGGDNASRYTEREVRNAVRESDVQIYAIGIFEPGDARLRTPEEASGPMLLHELAAQTGGRAFAIANLNELPDAAAKIGIELRNQYVLYYSPKNLVRDGKYRRVQVKLTKKAGLPALRPAFRAGYYAPAQ